MWMLILIFVTQGVFTSSGASNQARIAGYGFKDLESCAEAAVKFRADFHAALPEVPVGVNALCVETQLG